MQKKVEIVDIDGTIAKVGERIKYLEQTPKDWDAFYEACDEDLLISPIMDLIKVLRYEYDIVFCTGRREGVRQKTERWIWHNSESAFMDPKVLMRQDGDFRHDTEVKPEELMRGGYPPHTVAFILEDRNTMVAKWRELGFTCLQVAEGDF